MQVPADFKLIFVPSTAVIPEVIKVCGPSLAKAFSWVRLCAHFPWVVHAGVGEEQHFVRACDGRGDQPVLWPYRHDRYRELPCFGLEELQCAGLTLLGCWVSADLLTLVVATAEAKELVDVLCRNQVDWETFIQTELQVFRDQTIADMTSTFCHTHRASGPSSQLTPRPLALRRHL